MKRHYCSINTLNKERGKRMFCKNCGKENSDGSQVCKFCGQNLTSSVTENSIEPMVNTKKNKKTKIVIISVIVILALLVGGGLFFMFRTTTPNMEQLKSDFISEVLKDEKYSISKFDVINETDGKNDNYNAIIDVTYDYDNVEYHRQYEFFYKKYKEWVFADSSDYNEDTWEVKPTTAPSASDYTENCKSQLLKTIKYDKFEPVDSKTTVDLEAKTATFVYSVESKTDIRKISGEINFYYEFNDEKGEWVYKKFSYADSYNKKYDLIKTWTGSSKPYLSEKDTDEEVTFKFETTKCEGKSGKGEGSIQGVLTYNDEKHDLTGTISDTSNNSVTLVLYDKDEKIKFVMYIKSDGSTLADVDMNYNPNELIYFADQKTKYNDIEMSLN